MPKSKAAVPAPNPVQIPRTEKYLRNRPFLVIGIISRPSQGVNTSKPGWAGVTGSTTVYEQPSLVDRVNDSHLKNASVIIDVINGKIVKNTFKDTPASEVVNHYLEKYRPQVTEAMDIWLNQVAAKVAKETPKPSVDATYSIA